jgi:hypothetical protein
MSHGARSDVHGAVLVDAADGLALSVSGGRTGRRQRLVGCRPAGRRILGSIASATVGGGYEGAPPSAAGSIWGWWRLGPARAARAAAAQQRECVPPRPAGRRYRRRPHCGGLDHLAGCGAGGAGLRAVDDLGPRGGERGELERGGWLGRRTGSWERGGWLGRRTAQRESSTQAIKCIRRGEERPAKSPVPLASDCLTVAPGTPPAHALGHAQGGGAGLRRNGALACGRAGALGRQAVAQGERAIAVGGQHRGCWPAAGRLIVAGRWRRRSRPAAISHLGAQHR